MLRITYERKKRDWTKTKLAREAKVQLSHLSRIEHGKAKPYEPARKRLAEVLDIPKEKLLDEVDSDERTR